MNFVLEHTTERKRQICNKLISKIDSFSSSVANIYQTKFIKNKKIRQ